MKKSYLILGLVFCKTSQVLSQGPIAPSQPVSHSSEVLSSWAVEVKERGTGKAISGATAFLVINNQRLRSESDTQGRVRFDQVPTGNAELIIQASGYQRLQRAVEIPGEIPKEIPNANRSLVVIRLERESYQRTYETTVTGLQQRKDGASRKIRQEQFLTVPGAGGDPVKATQNLPGVNRSSGFSSQVVVQGSGPQDTKYQIDGHEVPIIFHFGGLSSVFFPEAVDSVDLLTAGYDARSGRATGGRIALNTRSPRMDESWQGLAFVDIFNAGVLVETPINKDTEKDMGIIVGFRQSYIGPVLKQIFKDNSDFNLTVAPAYTDFSSVYEWRIDAKNHFRLTSIYSNDSLEFLIAKPVDLDPGLRGNFSNNTWFYRFIPQWTHRYSDSATARLSFGLGQDRIKFDAGEDYFDLRTRSMTTRGEWEQRWNSHWSTLIGWDNVYYWADVNIQLPNTFAAGGINNPFNSGERRTADLYSKTIFTSLYLMNPFQIGSWEFQPDLRFDCINITSECVWSPRPALRYRWNEVHQAYLHSGIYYQAPENRQVDRDFGNPNVKSSRAAHLALGWSGDFRAGSSTGWNVSSEVFSKYLDRQVVTSTAQREQDSVMVPEFFNNSGFGQVYGIQTQSDWKQGPWKLSLVYTLSQSTRWQGNGTRYPAPFDQTHLWGLIGSYELGSNWVLSSRIRYASGNPTTPVVGASYDAVNDVYLPTRGAFFSERLPAFFQADLRIDKKWIYDTWILSAYLDIQNLTNRGNIEGVSYAYDYSKKDFVTGLPILTILGVKGEF